jgi:hypothetical protein
MPSPITWNAETASSDAANLAGTIIPASKLARDTDTNGLWVGDGAKTGGHYFAPTVTPVSFGIDPGSLTAPSNLTALFNSGLEIDLQGLTYTINPVIIMTPGLTVRNGRIIVVSSTTSLVGITINADNVTFSDVTFSNTPNRILVLNEGRSGLIVEGCTFTEFGDAYIPNGAGLQGSYYSNAIHLQSSSTSQITNCLFKNYKAFTAIRVEGSAVRAIISGNICFDTARFFIAVAFNSGGHYLTISNNVIYDIGKQNTDETLAIGACGIYCPAASSQPASVVTGNILRRIAENAIEGPWGIISNNVIEDAGYRDWPSVPPAPQYASLAGISTFHDSMIVGNRITRAQTGINCYANSNTSLQNIIIANNDITSFAMSELDPSFDIKLQDNGTVGTFSSNIKVHDNVCHTNGITALLYDGAENAIYDNNGALTLLSNSRSVINLNNPVAGNFSVLDRMDSTNNNFVTVSRLFNKIFPNTIGNPPVTTNGTPMPVFRIEVPAEPGAYSVFLKGQAVGGFGGTAVSMAFQGSFTRSTRADASGVTGLSVVTTSPSAANAASFRDISSISISTVEVTEQTLDVCIAVVATGSSTASSPPTQNIAVYLEVEVLALHTEKPILKAIL